MTATAGVVDQVRARLSTAATGGLDAAELARVWNDMVGLYGVESVRGALQQVAPEYAQALSAEAVDWLQKSVSSMDGHVDMFQRVLRTHSGSARLLDDGDGRLDADDWLISADGTEQRVGEVLRDRLRVSAAIVGAAYAMDAAGHDFELIKDHRGNPEFWSVDGSGVFTLQSGKKASEAVMDFFNSSEQYGFECATALVLTYYRAMLDVLGPDDFDRVCSDIRIGPWTYEDAFASVFHHGGTTSPATPARAEELDAGDYGYFMNFDVSDRGREAGWQGENIIYLGDGLFYGHPFGVSTADHIITSLNEFRKDGSTTSAALIDLQGEIDPATLVGMDATPAV